MEINEIISHLKDIPTWGWIVFAVILVMLFGDRKRWEYEVNISFIDNFGHGEIEIEASGNKIFKRERKHIEIELTLEPAAQNKKYDVFLNNIPVYSLSEHDTKSKHVRIHKTFHGDKPDQGDTIEIKCNNQLIFSGKLHKD